MTVNMHMNGTMNVFALSFVGGLVGAWLMDLVEARAARLRITSGVRADLLGRWVLGLCRGRIRHADVAASPSRPGEAAVGIAFHFLVGGGGVALLYPAALACTGIVPPAGHLLGGLVFGLATSLLPWFVLLPLFGWGVFGRRGPAGSNALLASPLSHVPYGLGVGAVVALGLSLR